ncbi:transporter [Sphingomonas sp. G124]|uniref:Transporter n=1 Tax=Sphingomonas cremea TaxID=2904799 RepID=A0A9X1QIQ7_9SPHN|nr:transporter [Sphingomonas cremea]MCF2514498.1 transporter [Sphingomonas cremea]
MSHFANRRQLILLSAILGPVSFFATPAYASEGGASFYLLGSGGPGAALLPPIRGIFFDNTAFHLSGKAKGDREFVVGGNVVAGLKAKINADFATLLWVPTTDFLGGTLGVGMALPIGRPDVDVDVILTGPRGNTIELSADDAATIIGDPITSATLSWPVATNTHVALSTVLNIPVGNYRESKLANLAFHRWVVDTSLALSWHDAKAGWDVSSKAGLTFNGENDFTDYDTGTEFHLEASVERIFSPKFSAGLQAYHFQQVSGDSGEGARLGAFKGRTTGVGATAAFNFNLGKIPVVARARFFEEFGVKNRLDSTTAFFSLTMPLHVIMPPGVPQSE